MRNLKKYLSVLLVVAIIATTMVPVFAAETYSYSAEAQKLNTLGLYAGVSTTTFDPDLGTALDRETGIVMLLRIFNLEATAKAMSDADAAAALAAYTDAKDVSAWALKSVAYAVKNGLVAGTTGTTIGPKVALNGDMYATLVLRQLGYTVGPNDFSNATYILADKGGLKITEAIKFDNKDLVKDDLVGITYAALNAKYSTGETVLAALMEDGVVTVANAVYAGVYAAPTATPTPTTAPFGIASVNILNAKQVEVTFTEPINSDTATKANLKVVQSGDASNIDRFAAATETTSASGIVDTGRVDVSADKKTVKITLNNGAALTNNQSVTVTAGTGLKTAAGVALSASVSKESAKLQDLSAPILVSATATGSKTIELKFSEPVTTVANNIAAAPNTDKGDNATLGAAGSILVDNGSIGVSSIDRKSSDHSVMVITLGADLADGDHTFKLNGGTFVDYVGYGTLTSTVTATYAKDTVIPTLASATAKNETTVRFIFSKDVSFPASANIEFRYAYNLSSANKRDASVTASITKVDGKTYDVVFPNAMTPGDSYVYIAYVSSTDTTNVIKDLYGNTVVGGASAAINVALDNVKPTVSSVTYVNATTIDVVFSEAVTAATALNPLNYTLKKGTTGYAVTNVAYKGTTGNYRLTVATIAAGGTFTLDIANVKDTSVFANTMDAYTTTLTVSDTVAPTILSVNKDAGTTTIYVQYSEAMALSGQYSVIDASNYRYATTATGAQIALPSGTTLVANGNIVKITLPSPLTVNDLYVGSVADVNGNKIVALQTMVSGTCGITASTNFTVPAPTSVKFTDKKTLSFKVARQLSSVNANQITMSAVAATGQSASFVNNSDGTATVTVVFDNPQVTDLTTTSPVGNLQIAAGALTDISSLTNTVAAFAVTASTADYIAPEIVSVTTKDTTAVPNGKIDRIDLVFSEGIKTGSFTASTFSVAGYSIKSVSQNAIDGNIIYINLTEGATPDSASKPAVTMSGSVQDASAQLNTATGLTMPSTIDGAAPVLLSATITAAGATAGFGNDVNDALTLVYSEAIYSPVADAAWTDLAPTTAQLVAAYTMPGATLAGITFSAPSIDTTGEAVTSITITATVVPADAAAVVLASTETVQGKAAVIKDVAGNLQAVGAAVAIP